MERRVLFGEDNDIVAEKLAKAQQIGLNSIVCIGDTLQERQDGQT